MDTPSSGSGHYEQPTRSLGETSPHEIIKEQAEQFTTCKKCEKKIPNSELDQHSKNECKHKTVPCEFRFAGCGFESSEETMPKHIQESTSKHLSLVVRHIQEDDRNHRPKHRCFATRWCLILIIAACLCFLVLVCNLCFHLLFCNIHRQELKSATERIEKLASEKFTEYDNLIRTTEEQLNNASQKLASAINSFDITYQELKEDFSENYTELSRKVTLSESDIHNMQNNLRLVQQTLKKIKKGVADLKSDVAALNSGFFQYLIYFDGFIHRRWSHTLSNSGHSPKNQRL